MLRKEDSKQDEHNIDKFMEDIKKMMAANTKKQDAKKRAGSTDERDKFDPNSFMQQQIKSELLSVKSSVNLHKICITGGPCAGKTTALAVL
jgi:hypothetical protein